MAEKHTPV